MWKNVKFYFWSRFFGIFGIFGRRGLKPRLRGTIFCRSRSPDLACSGSGDPELRGGMGTVARGPVPRDRGLARDRPSPYGERWRFFFVVRGPVPRECPRSRTMARDRPSPYGKTWGPLCRARSPDLDPFGIRRSRTTEGNGDRSAGACPPRSWPGEGQALALRESTGRRGLKPRPTGSYMVGAV